MHIGFAAFFQAEPVPEATFYRWRKQLANTVGAVPAAGFIDTGVMPSMTQCESACAALEVRLDGDWQGRA